MGLIGGYDGRLYCDHPDCKKNRWRGELEFESQGFEESFSEFIREARKLGWVFSHKTREITTEGRGYALCPKHSKKR